MPTWEVSITTITVQSMEVEADTMKDALDKARKASEEERGPRCTDWYFEASEIEGTLESEDD
jgi:hypothetical protein